MSTMNKGVAFTALAALLAALISVLCGVYAANRQEDGSVVYLNGAFTATGEETAQKGTSPENPFTKLSEAYEAFKGTTGGTIVVTGRTEFKDYATRVNAKQYDGTVVLTSVYGGVNYAETNGAKLVITGAFHQRGDVRYENITFVTRLNNFMHGNGHKMIFGEGVEVLQGTPEDENYTSNGEYAASPQYLVLRGGAESAQVNGDTYIEINSGKFSAIHCATKAKDVLGDVNIVINGAEILPKTINLGNDVAKDSTGATLKGTIHGNINITLSGGEYQKFTLNYINEISGSINIAANNGSRYTLSGISPEPNLGTFALKAEGNGKAEIVGTGEFRATADEGYLAVSDAVGGGTVFFTDEVITPEPGTTTVVFMDRENKPAPVYVSSLPTSTPEASDGALINVNPLMEYRLVGAQEYLPVTGDTVTGLCAGTYEVRYAAENGYPAGAVAEVLVSGRSAEYVYNEALQKRTDRIDEIRSTPSALSPDDYVVTYYVSPNGDDSADGLSPETAWKNLSKVSRVSEDENYVEGSTLVLFERGGLWRREANNSPALILTEGVHYSAYTGNLGNAKPTFYGSPENGAGAEKWNLYYSDDKTGAKIWTYYKNLPDVGVIVFNEGEENSVKEIPDYYDGEYFVRGTKKEVPFTVETCLDNDLESFNEYTDGQSSVYIPRLTSSVLYLRCDRGNPGEVFDSIEFNTRTHIVQNASNTVSDNICIKYGGSHGFGGSAPLNVTYINCEIGWIGGVVQMYSKSASGEFGTVTRFGNGIEIWQNCDGFYIDNCYVYQCYDAGITHQGRGASVKSDGSYAEMDAYMRDVRYTNNVLEYNVYNIEYFLSRLCSTYEKYDFPMMTDIYYTGNLMYYAGYGFGKQRPNPGTMTNIRTGSENPATNFHIDNNLFFDSVDYCTVTTCSKEEWAPSYNGNTFVQTRGRYLARHGAQTSTVIYYDEDVDYSARYILGDTNAECFYIEAAPHLTAVNNGDVIRISGLLSGIDDKYALSVDGGETWIYDFDSDTAEFSPSEVETICAYTLARSTNSVKSKTVEVDIELIPEFEFDGNILTSYDKSSKTVYLPANITQLADGDVTILGAPNLVYLSPSAAELAALLAENGIESRYYGDINLDGKVDITDISTFILTEARGTECADTGTADINYDGNVSLLDVSKLMKYLAGGDTSLGRTYNP